MRLQYQIILLMTVLLFSENISAASDVLLDNQDGSVTDITTGLMWQRESDNAARTYNDAKSYCNNLSLASHLNWRLPSIKELTSIVDYRSDSPAIGNVFAQSNSSTYWSNTQRADMQAESRVVFFSTGRVNSSFKTNLALVRCVRYIK